MPYSYAPSNVRTREELIHASLPRGAVQAKHERSGADAAASGSAEVVDDDAAMGSSSASFDELAEAAAGEGQARRRPASALPFEAQRAALPGAVGAVEGGLADAADFDASPAKTDSRPRPTSAVTFEAQRAALPASALGGQLTADELELRKREEKAEWLACRHTEWERSLARRQAGSPDATGLIDATMLDGAAKQEWLRRQRAAHCSSLARRHSRQDQYAAAGRIDVSQLEGAEKAEWLRRQRAQHEAALTRRQKEEAAATAPSAAPLFDESKFEGAEKAEWLRRQRLLHEAALTRRLKEEAAAAAPSAAPLFDESKLEGAEKEEWLRRQRKLHEAALTRRQKEAAAAAAPGAAPLVDASSLSRTSDKDLWLAHKRSEWEHGIRRRRSLESGQPYRPPMAGGGELERPFVPDDYDGSELDELEQLNNRVRGNAPAPASPQSVHASRSPSRSPSRPISAPLGGRNARAASAPLFSASSLSACGSPGPPPLSTIAARSSTSPTRSGEGSPLNGTPRRDVLRLEEITILRLR